LPVAIVVLLITTVPFLASGRIGVLGVSFLNDTHWHLFLAQGLLQPSIQHLDDYGVGYPIGPHALSATFAQGLGTSVDRTLTGLLIATPVLTGLGALELITDLPRTRRWLVAIVTAVPYLAVAWYVQSAFKEPIMSLLLLGLVAALACGHRNRFAAPAAVLVPIAVLTAGVLYVYSYPGLIWPVTIVACWFVLELALRVRRRHLAAVRAAVRGAIPALVVAALVLVVLVAVDAHRIYLFWNSAGGSSVGTTGGVTTTSLANLAGPLSFLEGFNIWLYGDFRFAAPNALQAGALAGFGMLVLVFAIVRALERRDVAWVGAVAGMGLIYAYAKHGQSPYVAAKALAVPGPMLAVGCGAALMREMGGRPWRSIPTVAVAIVSVVFFTLALGSSYQVLRDAEVGPSNHVVELRSLRRFLHGRPTLVLFYDDYFKWELLGVPVSSPLLPSPIPASVSPAKPWSYGQPLDFDSVDAATLNRFDYVITTRTLAQSQPPLNFHAIARTQSYEVWQRVGPTKANFVLPESGQPGAVLNCSTAAGRAVSRLHGLAFVRTAPIHVAVPVLTPGASATVVLRLPRGRWSLSLPFVSAQAVTVTGPGVNVWLPPNLDRPGSLWPVGTVRSTGAPIALKLTMADPGVISSGRPFTQYFTPQALVAVPTAADQRLRLSRACGRYVDSYQLNA
jgi:hypothetical protein